MFTVKTIINKTVHLHHLKSPVIALPGSPMWDQVMENLVECVNREQDYVQSLPPEESVGMCKYATTGNWRDLPAYDFLEYFPSFFSDPQCQIPEFPEEMIEGKREGFRLSECLGILLLDASHPERGALNDNEWTRGAFYQMFYPGDLLFATDCHGATVHKIA